MINLCPLCMHNQIAHEHERSMEMCFDCARKFGVRPMPPALRPPVPCTRCEGSRFVRTVPREHTNGVSAPMFLTHNVSGSAGNRPGGWFNGVEDLKTVTGHGQLEIYACVGCGAVEWYCHGVKDVPIHPHLMTEMVDYSAGGPYR